MIIWSKTSNGILSQKFELCVKFSRIFTPPQQKIKQNKFLLMHHKKWVLKTFAHMSYIPYME